MQTKSNIKPKEIEVEKTPGMGVVICRENIKEEVGPEGNTVYSYDEYRTLTPWRDNLAESVQANAQDWLEAGKKMEYVQAAIEIRAKRDELLRQSDQRLCIDRLGLDASGGSTIASFLPFVKGLASALTGEWAEYRQALRDVPQQEGFPFDVTWPVAPEEAKEAGT